MDILTYPVGVLIGILPVAVDLGRPPAPAELLLDGRHACHLTAEAPDCSVDLGSEPKLHLLELVRRRDESGEIVERAVRWVNKPGSARAEVHADVACDPARRECAIKTSWAHPERAKPLRISVSVGGGKVFDGAPSALPKRLTVPWDPEEPATVVSVDAEFGDGQGASHARILGAKLSDSAEASLEAVPLSVAPEAPGDREIARRLAAAGLPVRGVEKGHSEIVFVVQPSAVEAAPKLWRELARKGRVRTASGLSPGQAGGDPIAIAQVPIEKAPPVVQELADVDGFNIVVANERLSQFDAFSFAGGRAGWLRALAEGPGRLPGRSMRTSDAVVAAAYAKGAGHRRRVLVLIAGRAEPKPRKPTPEEKSRFQTSAARSYLAEILVPFVVWRVGTTSLGDWPEAKPILSLGDFENAVSELGRALHRQRIAWLEGPITWLPTEPVKGIALAGREHSR